MSEYNNVLTPEEEEQVDLWFAQEKFPTYTLAEATAAAEEQDNWLVPGLIGSTSTLVYGEAKIGKSWLIAHLIGALMNRGEFLGVQVPDKEYSVGVCYTDDAGHREYAQRIGTAVEGTDHAVTLYGLGIMKQDDWDALHLVVKAAGHDVLIIDNLTQILDGSIIDDDVIRRCFNGIRRFIQEGIPVIVVGHSTDSPSKNGWKPNRPMGSAAISQSVRWLMQLRTAKDGNLDLKTYGNIDYGRTLTVKPGEGARFTIVKTDEKSGTSKTRNRSKEMLDRNADMARFVVENCQGMSRNKAALALADNFKGSDGTYRNSLSRGPLSKLVKQTGTNWELLEHS